MIRHLVRIAVTVAIVGAAAAYVLVGAGDPWDFRTYYYAGVAFRAGLNPYDTAALSMAAGQPLDLPFLYPPITLAAFAPLSALRFSVAAGAWLLFKLLLLMFLIGLWRLEFLRRTRVPIIVAAALLGFNLAVLWDLRTGNVALVEATLLWLAFSSYLRNRVGIAVYLIALASVFKLMPILLLGLVLLAPRSARTRWALLTAGLVLLLVTVSVPAPLSAEWRHALLTSWTTRPTGDINPSALGLADWLVGALELPSSTAPALAFGSYLIYCVLLLILSLGALLRAHESGSRLEQVMLVVLLWLLLSPRIMVYSYCMAIVPVLYGVETRIRSRAGRWAALLAILLQGLVRLAPGRPPEALAPLSFLILLGAWFLLTRLGTRSPSPAPR